MYSRSALFSLLFFSIPVLADYNTGLGAYSRKDFAKAQAEFLQVAKLADAGAQRSLASMYARGEGGPVDLLEGFAWASLAAAQGDATAIKIRDAIAAGLTPALRAQAEARHKVLDGKYGLDAFSKNFLPQFNNAQPLSLDPRFEPAQASIQEPIKYPEKARERNVQGAACFSFYVNLDGKAVGLRSELADSNGTLNDAVEAALGAWQFRNPAAEQRVEYCAEFLLVGEKTWRPEQQLLQQQAKVRNGDARSLLDLARELDKYQHALVDRVGPADISRAWFNAAQAGAAEAQFELASRLLRGDGCVADRNKALHWLGLALEQGYVPAQQFAATYFSTDKSLALSQSQQLEWLRAAAAAGNTNAALALAKQLLRPGPARDPETALSLLAKLKASEHIHVLDWRAYAAALLGEFGDATDDAEDALELATELGLATQARQRAVDTTRAETAPDLPQH